MKSTLDTTLWGTSDAGNPHVAPTPSYGGTGRFDGGKVAAENPRRASPLYNKRICGITLAAVALVTIGSNAADDEYLVPVRPIGVNGQPAWNVASKQFTYAPTFGFGTVSGAVRYRFEVTAEADGAIRNCGTIFVSHDHAGRDREAVVMVHRFTEADILAQQTVSSGSRLGIVAIRAMGTQHNRRKEP